MLHVFTGRGGCRGFVGARVAERADWLRNLATNKKGTINVAKHGSNVMEHHGSGRRLRKESPTDDNQATNVRANTTRPDNRLITSALQQGRAPYQNACNNSTAGRLQQGQRYRSTSAVPQPKIGNTNNKAFNRLLTTVLQKTGRP